MKKEATIYDIAKKLGLSASTVSRALKNNPIINEETRKKVNDYAQKIGYRSNAFASNLRTKKTNTVGIIVPRLDSNFMSGCLAGMEEVASENGYNLLITQSHESKAKEEANSTVLFNKRVDGLLVSLSKEESDLSYFKRFEDKNVPLVFFDRVPSECPHACFVIDNEQMAYKATKHLIEQGCNKLLHITTKSKLNVYLDRIKGFKRAVSEKSHAKGELLYLDHLNLENGKASADQVIANGTDGLFVSNDLVAAGCLVELQSKGKKIPDDIAIVGFNNDQVSTLVAPSLSTVRYPGKETGKQAMHALLKIMKGETNNTYTLKLDTELIIRQSSNRNKQNDKTTL